MSTEQELKVTHCNLLKFRCDQSWESLTQTDDARVRFCQRCQEFVYFCSSRAEFEQQTAQRHCLAFVPGGWTSRGAAFYRTMVGTPSPDGVFGRLDTDHKSHTPPESA